MAKEERPRKLLSSWKEVAAYLGCDKRTCFRWEKALGLPVRRVEGTSRSRIFAYADEIDRWREERLGGANGAERAGNRLAARVLPWAGLLALGLIAAIFLPKLFASRRPADFRIRGSVLSILNEKGRELWRYDTGLENLVDEAGYRACFQYRRIDRATWAGRMPHLVIKDIDGDGGAEVLFSTQTQDELNEGEIICFGHEGGIRWRLRTGREMRFGEQDYSADYRIQGLIVADLNGDGRSEIVVASIHRPNFPCQLLVLDQAGKTRGEYWNSGHFNDITVHDLDNDGRPELIAGGTNNEYRSAFLAIFDPDRVHGASPQSRDEYICRGAAPGTQKAYILLPRTDVDTLIAHQDAVAAIEVLNPDRISALTLHTGLYYEFSFDLRSVRVLKSHRFEQLHNVARREGRVASVLDDAYFDALRRGVVFWNGTGWSGKPPSPAP